MTRAAVEIAALRRHLTTPLRLLLIEELLRAKDGASEASLGRVSAALAEDVHAALFPFESEGWLVRDEQSAEVRWAVAEGAREALREGFELAERELRAVLERVRFVQPDPFSHIVGSSALMQHVFQQARVAARVNVPVLLTGETGTGKELVAWAIHRQSRRSDGPFVAVNAAAVPTTLFESELFGHEKGAFTGAGRRKVGKLVAANGGTFFLDEVGDLGLAGQAKLLRAVQERVVMPVGGSNEVASDFRLITATNRDIQALARAGRFRDDLLYRINVLEIQLPPLRDRQEDVPELAQHFLQLASWRHAVPASPGILPAALARLQAHAWPGNVRELENTIYRSALLADGAVVSSSHIRQALQAPFPQDPQHAGSHGKPQVWRPGMTLDDVIHEAVVGAVMRHSGNLAAAARELSISRVTLYRRLRSYRGGNDDPRGTGA